jgi:hypothetical protein
LFGRLSIRCLRALLIALAVLLAPLSAPRAKVFYARDEAIKLAFPDAERVEVRDLFLTPEQREAIAARATCTLDSDWLTVYVGYRGGAIDGYAIFDTHTVRTLPETFLFVLSPQGAVTATHLLAFHEPLEYSPPIAG